LFFSLQYDEKTEEPGRNGWLLLSALNLLGAEGDSYAEVSFLTIVSYQVCEREVNAFRK